MIFVFNNLGDLEKLAKEAILVEHFATMSSDLITVQADKPIIEVLALMTANDFDVIPVVEGENWIGYVEKKDISKLAVNYGDKYISELQDKLLKPLNEAKFVDLDDKKANSLQMAFEHFNPPANEWFFVGRGEKIGGIVTFEDLGKPAVSLYLLAKLLMVEAGLRRLWGTYTNNPTTDAPPKKTRSDAPPKKDKSKEPKEPTVFSHIIKNVEKQSENNDDNIIRDLGYTCDLFHEHTNHMLELRNTIAHGSNILSFAEREKKDIKEVIKCIREIDKLLGEIRKLTQNRDQVWNAFEKSHIVTKRQVKTTKQLKKVIIDSEVWVGVNIVDLPKDLQLPVYVISAENPYEEVLSEKKNKVRTKAIRDVLNYRKSKSSNRKWEYAEVVGQSPDKQWKQDSFAVGGISINEARDLAEMFGQRAIFELTQEYIRVIPTDAEDKRIFENLPRVRE